MTGESSPPSGKEQRLVFRILNAWRELCDEDRFPTVDKVGPAGFGDDWSSCILLGLDSGSEDPVFEYIGENFDIGLQGKPLSDAGEMTLLGHGMAYWKRSVTKQAPITMGDEFVDADGRGVLYRSVILPLSDDGVKITALLGAANFKFKDEPAA
ncbi:MAG: hypothetical protein OQK07_09550 [Rhodospirillales bacterium]|nr:hypothetical protein [Rhodospirillales bacterium]